jgi:hypothetical protein
LKPGGLRRVQVAQAESNVSTTIEPNSASSKQAWQTDCSIDQSDCVDHIDLAGFSGFG